MKRPVMVELCCGTAVLSAEFVRLGWDVRTVDADPLHAPKVASETRTHLVADVRELAPSIVEGAAFVWGAPPCTEFSRHDQPWTRATNPPPPDTSIAVACFELARVAPLWGLENVRGAIRFLRPLFGPHVASCGRSFFVWGVLPKGKRRFGAPDRLKISRSSRNRVARGSYPAHFVRELAAMVDDETRLLRAGGEL